MDFYFFLRSKVQWILSRAAPTPPVITSGASPTCKKYLLSQTDQTWFLTYEQIMQHMFAEVLIEILEEEKIDRSMWRKKNIWLWQTWQWKCTYEETQTTKGESTSYKESCYWGGLQNLALPQRQKVHLDTHLRRSLTPCDCCGGAQCAARGGSVYPVEGVKKTPNKN